MVRVKKPAPTLDSVFFSTPEQKVMRLLLSESTTAFTPRVLASKLKGVRGLGGAEGMMSILHELRTLGLVDFVDNDRAIRLHGDHTAVQTLKQFAAICDLESVRQVLEPLSTKGVLFGSRATGRARSDSDYDLFVVTHRPAEVREAGGSHPLGKSIEIVAWTPEMFNEIETTDPKLARKLASGILLWG